MASVLVPALGARPTNALTDCILSVELLAFLTVWLRDGARPEARGKQGLFRAYAANLLGGCLWCAMGVYIHLWEPLPTERTSMWFAFLLLGASTPVLFPLVILRAFYTDTPASIASLQDAVAGAVTVAYAAFAASGMDLTGGHPVKPIPLSPWHGLDGRSYAGQKHGVPFDLMSSMPCLRSDSNFMLGCFFLISNGLCVLALLRVGYGSTHLPAHLRRAAQRLVFGVALMLLNSMAIMHMVAGIGFSVDLAIDIFHVLQGLIMFSAFSELRGVLLTPGAKCT